MEETIQIMGVTLRKPMKSPESHDSKGCEYLARGFCRECDCTLCGGHGYMIEEWRARQQAGEVCGPRECVCVQKARNQKHLRESGLEELVARCTFAAYQTSSPWQQKVKDKALEYLNEPDSKWFFICGQSGSGKTHICTAIAGGLMERGHRVKYFQWVRDSLRLKQLTGDREQYETELEKWVSAPILYIDDLFKADITDADIRLLYEILNKRYNKCLPTIISSERNLEQLRRARDGDGETLAGRIYEMCGDGHFCIELSGAEKNLRFRAGKELHD